VLPARFRHGKTTHFEGFPAEFWRETVKYSFVTCNDGRKKRPRSYGCSGCYATVTPGKFFMHDGSGNQGSHPSAPVFLRKGPFLDSQVSDALENLFNNYVVFVIVYLLADRHDFLVDKISDHIPHHKIFFFQKNVKILIRHGAPPPSLPLFFCCFSELSLSTL
jgi:hypothetical protein